MIFPGAESAESVLTVATAATAAAGVAGAEAGAVSAWSVTSLTSDLAAELFQASLLPYLAFLFFLSRKETKTPEGGTFGFAFLLVFVVATIPAGIYGEPLLVMWYLVLLVFFYYYTLTYDGDSYTIRADHRFPQFMI